MERLVVIALDNSQPEIYIGRLRQETETTLELTHALQLFPTMSASGSFKVIAAALYGSFICKTLQINKQYVKWIAYDVDDNIKQLYENAYKEFTEKVKSLV